jgi:hypothetical protein
MPKADVTLPSGAKISIEGSTEEVQQLLQIYTEGGSTITGKKKSSRKTPAKKPSRSSSSPKPPSVDAARVVNAMKDSDDWDAIEKNILDKRDRLPRVLLPLYAVKTYLKEDQELTSGDVNRITKELGVPVTQPNASKVLSGSGSKYVMGGRSRVKWVPVGYKLSRRGEAHVKSVLYPESVDS